MITARGFVVVRGSGPQWIYNLQVVVDCGMISDDLAANGSMPLYLID